MTKKILTLILAVCILLSIPAVYAAPADEYTNETAVETVTGIGLMQNESDGEFHGEKTMTRREGALIISKILFGADSGISSSPVFADIEESSPIHALAAAGILSEAMLFRPNAELSLDQAVTMLTRLMGYEIIAQQNGGYPYGYLNAASSEDILDGISTVGSDSAITKDTMALMLCNALEAPWLEAISYGDDISYEKKQDSTILKALGIETVEGRTVATEFASVEGVSESSGGFAAIESAEDGRVYTYNLAEGADLNSILNLNAVFYIDTRSGSNGTILCAELESLEALTIPGTRIISVSDSEIVYIDEDDEEETAELGSDLAVIYNENSISGDKFVYLQPETGFVTLYRFDGEDEYLTAFVYDYQAEIALRSYDEAIIVKRAGGSSATLDFSELESVRVIRDGKKADLDDIAANDVLHIAYSADGESVIVDAGSKSFIHGRLEGRSDGEVQIGDETYDVLGNIISSESYGAISLGSTATFWFNKNGRIFAYETDSILESVMRGYIIASSKGSGISRGIKLKILNEYGVVTVYDMAEKIKVTVAAGGSYSVIDGTADECSLLFDAEGKVISQFVKYKLDADDKITSIELAQDLTESGIDYDENNFSLVSSGALRYDNYNGGRFDNKYIMTTKTKVFVISEDGDDAKMKVTTPGTAFSGIYSNVILPDGQVALYDVNRYYQPAYVVYSGKPNYTPTNDSNTLIVNKIVHSIRSNGEEGWKLYGFAGGKSVTHFISDDIDHTTLSQGDFALYKTDENGIIMGIKKIYDYDPEAANFVESVSTNSSAKNDAANLRSDVVVYSGNAYAITDDGGYVVMSTDLPWDSKRGFKASAYYYVYDTKNEEIRLGTAADLHCSGDNPVKVVARLRTAAVRDFLIIE